MVEGERRSVMKSIYSGLPIRKTLKEKFPKLIFQKANDLTDGEWAYGPSDDLRALMDELTKRMR